ncbi:hypothetical protein BXZ70DRAFT_320165 [Cristinia sonorae]|uniref:Uncharacterized protein n=1 Tax=Cristinia sonorae TaxID=1940300 RepID=A0A8K0XNC3_9AGAR|nr:hypothetical protein BXZ70DRAFT_320165 [Cristinia sonorae]
MEDHPMSDDFPTSAGRDGRWIPSDSPGAGASQDNVIWKPSQGPCEELNNLMKQVAARPVIQQPPLFNPAQTVNAARLAPTTSTTSASTLTHRRSLPRSRSVASGMKKREHEGVQKLTVLIADVAHTVSENAKVKKRYLEKQKLRREDEGAVAGPSTKRVLAISRTLSDELMDSTNVDVRRAAARGKERSRSDSPAGTDPQKPWVFPMTNDSADSLLSGRSVEETRPCTPERQETRRAHSISMPPPPIPIPLPPEQRPPQRTGSRAGSTNDVSQPVAGPSSRRLDQPSYRPNTSNAGPTHPLPVSKPPPPPATTKTPVLLPQQHAAPLLRASQPAMPRPTPPPLGMRRAHTTGSTSGLVPKTLPTKQAAFKTPFARVPAGNAPPVTRQTSAPTAPNAVFSTTSRPAAVTRHHSHAPPPCSRTPSPGPADADSSFGDMPFDLADIDEAMSKYD